MRNMIMHASKKERLYFLEAESGNNDHIPLCPFQSNLHTIKIKFDNFIFLDIHLLLC